MDGVQQLRETAPPFADYKLPQAALRWAAAGALRPAAAPPAARPARRGALQSAKAAREAGAASAPAHGRMRGQRACAGHEQGAGHAACLFPRVDGAPARTRRRRAVRRRYIDEGGHPDDYVRELVQAALRDNQVGPVASSSGARSGRRRRRHLRLRWHWHAGCAGCGAS